MSIGIEVLGLEEITLEESWLMFDILSQLGPITRRLMRRLSIADVVVPKIWLKLFPVAIVSCTGHVEFGE